MNKMSSFSPKLEIINHFDRLINRVDIDIEKCLEKYKDSQIVCQLNSYNKHSELKENSYGKQAFNFFLDFLTPQRKKYGIHFSWLENAKDREKSIEKQNDLRASKNENQPIVTDIWPKWSTKIVDYLNQIRKSTIDELKKAQEETYLANLKHNQSDNQSKSVDEMKSQLYADKYYFQVCFDPSKKMKWIFNLYTFVTDFYMSPDDITLLEKVINTKKGVNESIFENHGLIFDEKLVLIDLLCKRFIENLFGTEQFPSHVIRVSKCEIFEEIRPKYALNGIDLKSTDLPKLKCLTFSGSEKLDKINIHGHSSLESLHLKLRTAHQISLRNLTALRHFDLVLNDKETVLDIQLLLDQIKHIEYLSLCCDFSNINLDSFVYLKSLCLIGSLNNDFNSDLFTSICNQLEELRISISNCDDDMIVKLFYGRSFPNLSNLDILFGKITKLEKKFFDAFPMLQTLSICNNERLRYIDHDAFSNLKRLTCLDISNNSIEEIDKRLFSQLVNITYLKLRVLDRIEENAISNLKNLKVLDLSGNRLKTVNSNIFKDLEHLIFLDLGWNKLTTLNFDFIDNIGQEKRINLNGNPIKYFNKEEIIRRFEKTKIKLIF